MNLSLGQLVLSAVLVAVVVMFGATMFSQGIINGGYATQDYPLAQSALNFNNTMANFTSGFINNTNSATGVPTSTNPTDAFSFALGKAVSVVGLVWSVMGLVIDVGVSGMSSLVASGIVPVWIVGIGIFGVMLLFGFAALQYVLRWFS